jgi:fused signal recognition particle receptor
MIFESLKNLLKKNSIEEKIKIHFAKELLSNIVEIKLSDKEIDEISEKYFFDLLEADVPYEVAIQIRKDLQQSLKNQKFTKEYKKEIEYILKNILLKYLEEGTLYLTKPFIIMLIGPNGYGKTSAAAKIGHIFSKHHKVGIIGADAFRAAAREQLEKLCKMAYLDFYTDQSNKPLPIIKNGLQYFKDKDIIIIDTAGRQDLNYQLLKELEAITKNVNINLILYVLESAAGNAAFSQISEYRKFIRIDGVVLTKADLDTKGGSILASGYYNIPIYFITYGLGIEDAKFFNKREFIEKICC